MMSTGIPDTSGYCNAVARFAGSIAFVALILGLTPQALR